MYNIDFTFFLLFLWALEHIFSGPGMFVSALGLCAVIVHSKAGEHHFVLQPVSLVWVDKEEGVKQLDKMALMCLKNLLSLIKAHTHAAQRQTEQTQFSAPSSEWLFSTGFSAALLCAWNQDQVGFVSSSLKCHSHRFIASSLKERTTGIWLYRQIAKCNFVHVLSWLYFLVWSLKPQECHSFLAILY